MSNLDERGRPFTREQILPPGTFIYVQDGTNGRIKTHVGPTVVTLTGTDQPTIFDFKRGGATFSRVEKLEDALQKSIVVPEGHYAIMVNPAKTNVHPEDHEHKLTPDLDIGQKVIITGPKMFALWPGQHARVIRGHHLRSNEYLLCRVYNQEEARKNWSKTKIVLTKPIDKDDGVDGGGSAPSDPGLGVLDDQLKLEDLTIGKLIIIRGTEVSFYIPPTGIAVLPDDHGGYVRKAITLEQLQYCILLDEDGNKRYVHGPDVVFPEPTETFIQDSNGEVVFAAIELNNIQGIHVKVTRDYKDPALGDLKEGQECFITGRQYPIYFPREENVIVKYDGRVKYFAVAVPEGEARYVMKREHGVVDLVKGPCMLLPNPVDEVIIRRALSDKECEMWYPGNAEVINYNRALRSLADSSPTTRAGAVSEGDVQRGARRRGATGDALRATMDPGDMVYATGPAGPSSKGIMPAAAAAAYMQSSAVSVGNVHVPGDEISRQSTYTQPRTITLKNKFEGAPVINVFTGFAVMVVNSSGKRRVEQGPCRVILAYDETLEIASMSTGKPKNTEKLVYTPYLRVKNNKVADIVRVMSSDHVLVDLKLSYHVDFTGDPNKWWDVENYVKFMCDHMRSGLKAAARKLAIEELYANPLELVNNVVLNASPEDGELGPDGTVFEENGMVVSDVELLGAEIPDGKVANMLMASMQKSVERSIHMSDLKNELDALSVAEEIKRTTMNVKFETQQQEFENAKNLVALQLEANLSQLNAQIEQAAKRLEVSKREDEIRMAAEHHAVDAKLLHDRAAIVITKAQQELEIERLMAEAEALTRRFTALAGGLSEALLTLSSQRTLADVAQALSVQKMLGGQNVVDTLNKMFEGSHLSALLTDAAKKATSHLPALANGNGHPPETAPST